MHHKVPARSSSERDGRWRTIAARLGILTAIVGAGLLALPHAAAPEAPLTLVLCAPGYPGTTAEAQSAMDALASAVTARAGWKAGELKAVYFENEKAGLERLAEPDAALALVPLPFWLEHRQALELEPHLQAIEQGGQAAESWSLVAASGAVTGPASLAGFELVSTAGYSARFVRGPALGTWGNLPPTVTITFSSAVLTGLRRASSGNKVALLLDRPQAAALPTLPFASKLQIVARSEPLPVSVLSVVNKRVSPARLTGLLKGFTALAATPSGVELLAGVRLSRFVQADQAALTRASGAFDRARQ
jgi:hypothetical protein